MKTSFLILIFLAVVAMGYVLFVHYNDYTNPQENFLAQHPQIAEVVHKEAGERAVVEHVIDGDTFVVTLNQKREKVRLIGINTPEVGQCYATEATNRLKELVLGKEVVLVEEVTSRDAYARMLRDVYVNGIFVNEILQREGFSRVMAITPNTQHAANFALLQIEAEAKKIGLWGVCQ